MAKKSDLILQKYGMKSAANDILSKYGMSGEATSMTSPAGYQEDQKAAMLEALASQGRGAIKGASLGYVDLLGEEAWQGELAGSLAPYILASALTGGASNIPAVAGAASKLSLIPKVGRFIPGMIQAAAPMAAVGALRPAETMQDRLRQAGIEGGIGAGFNLAGKAALPLASRFFGTTTGIGKEKMAAAIKDVFSKEPKILSTLSKEKTKIEAGQVAGKAFKASEWKSTRAERYLRKVVNSDLMKKPVEKKAAMSIADNIDDTISSVQNYYGATSGNALPESVILEARKLSSQLRQDSLSGNLSLKKLYNYRDNILDEIKTLGGKAKMEKGTADLIYGTRNLINESISNQVPAFRKATKLSKDTFDFFEKLKTAGFNPKSAATFEKTLIRFETLPEETKALILQLDPIKQQSRKFIADTLNLNLRREFMGLVPVDEASAAMAGGAIASGIAGPALFGRPDVALKTLPLYLSVAPRAVGSLLRKAAGISKGVAKTPLLQKIPGKGRYLLGDALTGTTREEYR